MNWKNEGTYRFEVDEQDQPTGRVINAENYWACGCCIIHWDEDPADKEHHYCQKHRADQQLFDQSPSWPSSSKSA